MTNEIAPEPEPDHVFDFEDVAEVVMRLEVLGTRDDAYGRSFMIRVVPFEDSTGLAEVESDVCEQIPDAARNFAGALDRWARSVVEEVTDSATFDRAKKPAFSDVAAVFDRHRKPSGDVDDGGVR